MARTSILSKDSWNAKNYDTILLRIKKGEKDRLKLAAEAAGVSVSRLIVDSLNTAHPGLLSPLDDTSKQKKSAL